jgi:lysophospholipase L1-like esterase
MQRVIDLLRSPDPVKWLFYGDSITHGALHTFGFRDYTELFRERIRYELARAGDIVINTAYSGDTTHQLLAGFEWRVAQFEPQVVFIMIGTNDCSIGRQISREEFRVNLIALCRAIGELPGLPVLQTTCPILPGTSPEREPNFDAYMEIIREVAAQEKLPLIDHTRYWREAIQQQPHLHYFWMSDGFHPNYHGHRVFAELLFKELGIFDMTSETCKLEHP